MYQVYNERKLSSAFAMLTNYCVKIKMAKLTESQNLHIVHHQSCKQYLSLQN